MTIKYASIASSALPESKQLKSSTEATPFPRNLLSRYHSLSQFKTNQNGAHVKPRTSKGRQETKNQETNKKQNKRKNTFVRAKGV